MKRLVFTVSAALLLPVAAGPATGATATYRVAPGDTLSGIAASHGLSVTRLASINHLRVNGVLIAGTVLRLAPAPAARPQRATYVVQPGDTLTSIAVHYRTSVRVLARLNRLDPTGVLAAGKALVVPVAAAVTAPACSSSASHAPATPAAPAAPAAPSAPAGGTQSPPAVPASNTTATPSQVRALIVHWADYYGVSTSLALALGFVESTYRPDAVSSVGALGVMQIMPATWTYIEQRIVGAPVDHTVDGNIHVGIAYLNYLLKSFAGDRQLAVAAYNQGETSVHQNGILPALRTYVQNVLNRAAAAPNG